MLRNATLFILACVCLACTPPQDSRTQDNPLSRELDRLHIPEKLTLKDKQALFMVRGEGVQIYGAEEQKGKLEWVYRAPNATLLDYKTGEKVGTHSEGPTWLDADGGRLTGKKLEAVDAPNADAVPWLLLEVKSENGGRFANVTNIQRVDTWGGGKPPVAPTKVGETKEVRYEATYVFLGNR